MHHRRIDIVSLARDSLSTSGHIVHFKVEVIFVLLSATRSAITRSHFYSISPESILELSKETGQFEQGDPFSMVTHHSAGNW